MPVRLASHEEPLPGYKLLERLGRGGFGEVWKVEAPGGLHKAMKFVFGDLDSADDDGKPAEQELKALHRVKSIRHPYILSLERFDIIDGQLIIVMELADRNLWDRFRECRALGMTGIPRPELLQYMDESAEALDLMNNQYQIQHLDIKPQNIFLLYNHAKVADFGLAKDFEGVRGTMTGGVTPVYAAPETFEGFLTRFTDQYSLAIVFQELLTGTRPFVGSNTKQLLLQHLNSPPDLKALADADRAILGRALSKTPADRWPSCSDMVRALRSNSSRALLGSSDHAPRAEPTPLPPAPPKQSPSAPADGSFPAPGTTPTRLSPGDDGLRGYEFDSAQSPVGLRNTPLPGLRTPRLVTPEPTDGPRPAITLQRPQVFQTARMNSLGVAPPEKAGSGVLFPALVIGIGQTGLGTLKALRELVQNQFDSTTAVPNVRFLFIDTDPAVDAVQGPGGLASTEVVMARLNRPAHYLQRDGLPPVEQWLPKGLLYQLPKNPGPTNGIRPFGRLALCDHYRQIAQRIRQEIEPFLTDDLLDAAGNSTGLGVRSNRPRVYLVANLAGGTGGGMLVDLAYIVRHELKAVGYRKPDTVGVLFAPSPETTSGRPAGVANAFAALVELAHYGDGNRYVTRFDTNEAPISDPDGPLTRMMMFGLPRSSKEHELNRTIGGAAHGLFLELLTPAGPVIDAVRQSVEGGTVGTRAELVGTYRLSWPRARLIAAATRRFAQRLVQRWTSRDAAHLREPIGAWLAEQWGKRKLDWGPVRDRLTEAVRDTLRDDPATVFDAAVDALRTNTPTGSRVDQGVACEVLDRLIQLVGKPGPDTDVTGTLPKVLEAVRKQLSTEADTSLAVVTVSFLEQPQYRLAGAEEALNQVAKKLRRSAEELEPVRDVLARDTVDGYARIVQLIASLKSGWKGNSAAELMDLLFSYPTKKLDLAVCEAGIGLYRTLLNNVPEYRQEVNFCRKRFEDLGIRLAAPVALTPLAGPGDVILPAGCANLDEAADEFLGKILPEDILGFDQKLQSVVKKQFRGMVNVCLKPERSGDFLALVADESRAFLDARLARTDPAAVFLDYCSTDGKAEKMLQAAVAGAIPKPYPPPGTVETVILAVPPGADGDRVRALATAACTEVTLVPTTLPDDIVVYRTCPQVSLATLPQSGEAARAAYQAHVGGPLHTRTDVAWGE